MANERITEDIVRQHFKSDPQFSKLKFEEQKSTSPKIDKLLKSASKKGCGQGYPEFIISNIPNAGNLIIVIECKFDSQKHESHKRDKYADYAVDGCLLYSDYLSETYDVLSIAVSGVKDDLKVSHFLQPKGRDAEEIFGSKLLPIEDYVGGYNQDEEKRQEKYEEILIYSKVLNDDLHQLKIREDKRSLLLSGILIALNDESFRRSYKNYSFKRLAKLLLEAILGQFKDAKLQENKLEKLEHHYAFIVTHDNLIKKQSNAEFKALKDIIGDVDEHINGFARTYRYYDVLGQFYIEFLRYSNSDKGLGIVLTPPHITEFFAELAGVTHGDVVYDNCTGTGGFLVTAMKKMIKDARGDKKLERHIKQNQLYGVEFQPEIYPLAVSNMFLHGDGKSNILDGDCFNVEVIDQIKGKKPTVGFLNPPYKAQKDDREELEFILNNLEVLSKNGRCVAIVPMSCVLAQKGEILKLKERLLEKHTLKGVFSMPDELFFNSKVAAVTAILFFEAHIPHSDKKSVFFGYFKNDGFIKKKTKGRTDHFKKWGAIKKEWLYLFEDHREKPGLTVRKKITAQDEWCAEAYMETDYSTVNDSLYTATMKNYALYCFKNNLLTAISDGRVLTANIPNKLDEGEFFRITDFFEVKGSKSITKHCIQEYGMGEYPYVVTSSDNNGVQGFYDYYTETGNVLTIDSATVGSCFYQALNFSASDHVEKLIPKFPMNVYVAMFIVTLINKEQYRYGYGRKFSQTRIKSSKIKLPITPKGAPDWQFMEEYIKSLPYSKNLEHLHEGSGSQTDFYENDVGG